MGAAEVAVLATSSAASLGRSSLHNCIEQLSHLFTLYFEVCYDP